MEHLSPAESYAFMQAHADAVLIDVRMEIEFMYVGHPPGAVNIPWYEYPDMQDDAPAFVAAVEREVKGEKHRPVLLICRSAKRTIPAGLALDAAGFQKVINVLHGFEGDLDDHMHRGTRNGWRKDGLPWQQM